MKRSSQLLSVVSEYFANRPNTGRYWPELNQRFEREIIPALGKYKLIENISKADIRELIKQKARQYPAAARTMYDALVPFFKWCLEEDYIITHPMITLSAPPAPDARERILSEDEIRQLWKVTNDGWYWSPFYRLLLLTGQRRQEIAMLPREAIDTNAQLFIIPSSISKTKVANALPMLPMISYEFSRSRFLGKNPSGFSKAKAVLDQRLGFSDFRIHDLRRSCASYLALLGTDPWTIERILNHRLPGVQGVYNRYSYLKEKKHALEKWCRYISELT